LQRHTETRQLTIRVA